MGQEKGLTRNCIFTALLMLMEQKEYKYITITDITRKAGVSRMTYYRTYSSKEDILVQQFQEIAQTMIQAGRGASPAAAQYHGRKNDSGTAFRHRDTENSAYTEHENRAEHALYSYFTFFQEHDKMLRLLEEADLTKLLLQSFSCLTDYLYYELHPDVSPDQQNSYALRFQSGGLFSLLSCWMENGRQETPEQMADMALQMIED